jgi:xylan 1,4-beta-xylosidase
MSRRRPTRFSLAARSPAARSALLIAVFCRCAPTVALADTGDSFPVAIHVDVASPLGEWRPVWRFFGADEPNYAYMKDGQKLLTELGELRPGQVFFRTHNLLTSGDGTPALKWGSTGAYRQDANGEATYDWTITDRIFATYIERGVHPYVEIGFMPKDLSTHPDPYQHHWSPQQRYEEIFTGWAYPPTDYNKWEELVYEWTKHCVEKFGRDEVERWYWEVWNESNIPYWKGTPAEFRRLHDCAIAGVRRALPTAKVGGPDVAGDGGKFTRDFFEHCLHEKNEATGEIGTPLDFVSFHSKGKPEFVAGHVRMGIADELRTIDAGFKIVASFPELKDLPIVIGECDPDTCAACQGPQLGYRNGPLYASYTAASFARILQLARQDRVNLDGILTWAFEFEEQPYFAGFRVLATNGIDLPVLNVFRMFAKMSGTEVAVTSDGAVPLDEMLAHGVREHAEVSAIASLDHDSLYVLVWHYHDEDLPGPPADVSLTLDHLPIKDGKVRLEQFQVDGEHSNAIAVWHKMGDPQSPTSAQLAELEHAGQLAHLDTPPILAASDSRLEYRLKLPRQSVALVHVTWTSTTTN